MSNIMVKNWKQFNESFNIPGVRLDEITVGMKSADKGHKTMVATYFNTFENYIDDEDTKKHIYKVNDLTGDILNSGRVQFRVLILGKQEIEETVKNNISNLSMSEFYTNLPDSLDIYGIKLKPISFVNKEDLKFYTIYAVPHHKGGIVRETKEDAEENEEEFDGQTTEL